MTTKIIQKGTPGCRGYMEAAARFPSEQDIDGLKPGDFAPTCFGGLGLVTRVAYRGTVELGERRGRKYVGYVTALDGRDTVSNGCGCSMSMQEGRLIRTVALTGILNSAECDDLEAREAL